MFHRGTYTAMVCLVIAVTSVHSAHGQATPGKPLAAKRFEEQALKFERSGECVNARRAVANGRRHYPDSVTLLKVGIACSRLLSRYADALKLCDHASQRRKLRNQLSGECRGLEQARHTYVIVHLRNGPADVHFDVTSEHPVCPRTELCNKQLLPGKKNVIVSRKGYQSHTETVTVVENRANVLHVELQPIPVELHLTVHPSDAQVTLDGDRLRAEPSVSGKQRKNDTYRHKLAPGKAVIIKVEKPGYLPQIARVDVHPGEPLRHAITMQQISQPPRQHPKTTNRGGYRGLALLGVAAVSATVAVMLDAGPDDTARLYLANTAVAVSALASIGTVVAFDLNSVIPGDRLRIAQPFVKTMVLSGSAAIAFRYAKNYIERPEPDRSDQDMFIAHTSLLVGIVATGVAVASLQDSLSAVSSTLREKKSVLVVQPDISRDRLGLALTGRF